MERDYNVVCIDREGREMVMPLERAVGILLRSEIDLDYHIEALKAQAVVLRTNLFRNSNKVQISRFQIYPHDEYSKKIEKALKETEGLVITYNGKLIDAKYHPACGGSTENSENVLKNSVSYLRRVLCDYCKHSSCWRKEKSFTVDEMEKLLRVKFPNSSVEVSPEIEGYIQNIEKDEYGRVKSIQIGGKKFTGVELMEILSLDSTRFSIFPTEIKFVSKGKGHGIGLCQYGANKMAEEGYSFKEILNYYYTGIEIENLTLPDMDKPLYGKKIMLDPGHGGRDTGYKGDYLGLLEKDIVLNLALELRNQLESLGAVVYMTRQKDEEVLTVDRLKQANQIEPDFFISIHMDYFPKSSMKGVEMYHFQDDEESRALGQCIYFRLKEEGITVKRVKEANFYIFRGIGTSSLLIEVGYLSNEKEEIKFKDSEYVQKIIKAIVNGILDYYVDFSKS